MADGEADSEEEVGDDTVGSTPSAVAGGADGAWRFWELQRAREVADTLERLRRAVPGMSESEWLKDAARKTRVSTGPNGKSGALGQFRGHLFERLDVDGYNGRRAGTGPSLRLRPHAHALATTLTG